MNMLRPPMTNADLWSAVMERAHYRCECSGQCGRRHTGGRCPNGDRARERLMAVSPDPDHSWSSDPYALVARCPTCWRKWLASLVVACIDQEGLF
jgi:hypothetical protein